MNDRMMTQCRLNQLTSVIFFLLGPLKDNPNVLCTPHSAYYSDQSVTELREMGASEIRRSLVGRIPDNLRNCVNKQYFVPKTGETFQSDLYLKVL